MLRVMLGFFVGYVLGTRAGRERYLKLRESCVEIARSPEFQDVVAAARELGRASRDLGAKSGLAEGGASPLVDAGATVVRIVSETAVGLLRQSGRPGR